ncbi:polar amino acid transport system permease protein [Pseudomonas sp. SJZ079]|jgi:His/Glu/Gln/Arg/opine family amino acid ABC transporter permease subunit|uniref:amino acid ABC transporter permease n=1 Tax=Pseudomonas sp. SJZ079 TaxID=2572887 RepID=UPI001199F8A4|nr:amino acid ABC transporter permease [Pseudomonas sp. SJZ079]TWC34154.1 polar amino acid transport system permease protein [Pseudomonas sp. SJZ079]
MNFDVSVFWNALISYPFFEGACITLLLALASHSVGIVLSIPTALALEGRPNVARSLLRGVVSVFRGAPTLLQLLFVWNALPQFFPVFREAWFTPFIAAWIALSLNEAAYQVEINRASLKSLDKGQLAACHALALSRWQTFRYVVLPQVARIAIPPTANEFITLLKITSLASVISLQELMAVTSQTVSSTFQFTEYYAVALVYYLVMVYTLSWLQSRLERRLSWEQLEETSPSNHPGLVQRTLARMRRA